MLRPPCKGCELREVGCHAKCKAYIEWAKEHEALREKDRGKRVIDFTIRKLRRERGGKNMIEISNTEVLGWEAAIRGMRNPLNSWDKSDSGWVDFEDWDCGHGIPDGMGNAYVIGEADHDLMRRLAAAGSDHAKYRRMITVYADLLAPLYWWKEYDTYKVGTVANSCSTMHKITDKEFTPSDFSIEHLEGLSIDAIESIVSILNKCRYAYLRAKDNGADGFTLKRYWWQMIQLLPSSYNQRRTIMVNYEVLANMYRSRRNHKLDEWREFCKWIESLPYSELITGGVKNDD